MSHAIVVIPSCTKLIDEQIFDAVGRKYSAAVAEIAECQPLLAPLGRSMADIGAVLDVADAILLPGSLSNLAPEHYGTEAPIDPSSLDPARDALTLPLIRAQAAAVCHLPRFSRAQCGVGRQPASGGARRGWTS
jgi:putative glutamine amidotransferase